MKIRLFQQNLSHLHFDATVLLMILVDSFVAKFLPFFSHLIVYLSLTLFSLFVVVRCEYFSLSCLVFESVDFFFLVLFYIRSFILQNVTFTHYNRIDL